MPLHEVVQTAHLGHEVGAGALREVVGVGQKNLGMDLLERGREDPLDRGLGTHGHENRCGDVAVRGVEYARARVGGGVLRDDVVLEHVAPSGLRFVHPS